MAYQAIVNGARGLVFFGGHLTQIATPADAAAGWNWTFWNRVLRPLVEELRSAELAPALVAPVADARVRTATAGIELTTRAHGDTLYVIAVRRSGAASRVRFTGLPARLHRGRVLFEYVQSPPPPPITAGHQVERPVDVQRGAFSDWFALHDVHVYRFD